MTTLPRLGFIGAALLYLKPFPKTWGNRFRIQKFTSWHVWPSKSPLSPLKSANRHSGSTGEALSEFTGDFSTTRPPLKSRGSRLLPHDHHALLGKPPPQDGRWEFQDSGEGGNLWVFQAGAGLHAHAIWEENISKPLYGFLCCH